MQAYFLWKKAQRIFWRIYTVLMKPCNGWWWGEGVHPNVNEALHWLMGGGGKGGWHLMLLLSSLPCLQVGRSTQADPNYSSGAAAAAPSDSCFYHFNSYQKPASQLHNQPRPDIRDLVTSRIEQAKISNIYRFHKVQDYVIIIDDFWKMWWLSALSKNPQETKMSKGTEL